MRDDFLMQKLRRVVRRYQWLGLWRKLALCWVVTALVGGAFVLAQRQTGWASPHVLPLLAATGLAVALGLSLHHFSRRPDLHWVAREIEARHPELDGVLLTAIQNTTPEGGHNGYLQYRVLQEATARSQDADWRKVVPTARFAWAHLAHLGALALLVFTLASLHVARIHGEAPAWLGADGVAVTPGDASIERGDSLVVLARFGGALPPAVGLVVRESGAAARTVPLVKSLADPVFGGSVSEVANDFTYHLEYRGQRTRDFKVTVYEHPRLMRSDVDLTFPGYTKLPPKHIEDTRRVSAVQGTKLDFALQLNKPVKSARLVARDGKKTEISLTVAASQAMATLPNFVPEKTQSYDLQLVDADGRANKVASSFVIDVQLNRSPEVKLASPRGDVRPSALEEVTFEGTVWDDFGASTYGLAYSINGAEPKRIELGRELGAKEKRSFSHLLSLEELGVKPDDLVAWHAWAEDVGADGKTRQTSGDLYFAEIRPFDEIFRESQDMQGESEEQPQGKGNQARKLTELQKQIINATWRLQRDGATRKYVEDVKVVSDSQEQALAQAEEAQEEARAPQQQALWKAATREMEKAIERLKDAAKDPAPLAQALPAEQAAYQALLKLQARETAVTRQRNRQKGGGGQQANQRQIDQLDLQQAENRYETQRQARAPQNQERREELAVMNRLQELARRQQDLNERMKELQTSLQEARTEQEREDIKRRLKRLQEEQQQMLADVDEVRQRMDRPENQSRMADERKQLEQTRDDVQKASEAAAEGSVAQALASGTRAQRKLQELRDEMRKQNSSQFAEDMREMRNEARELSRQQEEVNQQIDSLAKAPTQRKSLSDGGASKELTEKLDEQKERMNRLMDRATQLSEQAENTEPLLSRQLYDTIRKTTQDDANSVKQARDDLVASGQLSYDLRDRLQKAGDREGGGKALEVTSDMLREGAVSQAGRAGRRAGAAIDELKKGVERAAESVLGDDVEQLKLAQSELDALTDQLQRELAQAEAGASGAAGREGERTASAGRPGSGKQAGGQSEQERRAEELRQQIAEASGQGQSGKQKSDTQKAGGQRGQRGQPGQGGQPGESESQLASSEQQGGQPGEQQEGQQPGGEQPGQQGERMAGNTPGQQGQQGQQGQKGKQGQGQQGQGQQGQQGQQAGQQSGQQSGGSMAGGPGGRNQRPGDRRSLSVDDLLSRGPNRGVDTAGGGRGGWGGDWSGAWNPGGWDGPLTGEEFARWAERLRDVEELLDTPDLRNAVAAARERARLLRRDFKQDLKKPDWTVVKLEILKPLVEVRSRVADELSRRDSKDSLAPIDRDPVPNRFAESVRRYYEELGKDK